MGNVIEVVCKPEIKLQDFFVNLNSFLSLGLKMFSPQLQSVVHSAADHVQYQLYIIGPAVSVRQ